MSWRLGEEDICDYFQENTEKNSADQGVKLHFLEGGIFSRSENETIGILAATGRGRPSSGRADI